MLEPPDDIMKGGRTEEVFLLQTQLLALKHVVVGVQHTGNVLGQVTVKNSLKIIRIIIKIFLQALSYGKLVISSSF